MEESASRQTGRVRACLLLLVDWICPGMRCSDGVPLREGQCTFGVPSSCIVSFEAVCESPAMGTELKETSSSGSSHPLNN